MNVIVMDLLMVSLHTVLDYVLYGGSGDDRWWRFAEAAAPDKSMDVMNILSDPRKVDSVGIVCLQQPRQCSRLNGEGHPVLKKPRHVTLQKEVRRRFQYAFTTGKTISDGSAKRLGHILACVEYRHELQKAEKAIAIGK